MGASLSRLQQLHDAAMADPELRARLKAGRRDWIPTDRPYNEWEERMENVLKRLRRFGLTFSYERIFLPFEEEPVPNPHTVGTAPDFWIFPKEQTPRSKWYWDGRFMEITAAKDLGYKRKKNTITRDIHDEFIDLAIPEQIARYESDPTLVLIRLQSCELPLNYLQHRRQLLQVAV